MQSTIFSIDGGTRPFAIAHTLLPWHAHKQGLTPTTALGLRTYCALSEIKQRRAFTPTRPTYTPKECAALLGHVRPSTAEHAIEDLQAVGLVDFHPHHLRFASSPEDVPALNRQAYDASLRHVHPARRTACIPRRMVRYLAREGSPGLIATVFGVALRFRHHPETGHYAGTISPDWLSMTLDLSERTAYRGLQTLEDLTYLLREDTPAWYTRQYGRKYRINPTWTPPDRPSSPPPGRRAPAPEPCTNVAELATTPCKNVAASAPLARVTTRDASPSYPFQERSKDQESLPPADPDPPPPAHDSPPDLSPPKNPGVSHKASREAATPLQAPTLGHVVPEDLRDTPRLMDLYGQATRQGLIGSRKPDRLTFVVMAEYALRVGKENPCGLFRQLLHQRSWAFTDSDDVSAQARLKMYDHGTAPQVRAQPPPARQDAPGSGMDDALRVRALVQQMGGELGQAEVLAWIAQKERWTLARVRGVEAAFASWTTGGTAHAPPTRLLEPEECAMVVPLDAA